MDTIFYNLGEVHRETRKFHTFSLNKEQNLTTKLVIA